ncbi:PAS domain S-box-containing protein [Mariprofundus ferrinatatus]|uniref:histidine kinase n=1 Tax=Mariprofundus ferrinatatus TaxID=1921087 RepID=A0A2K8L6C3_9PROT|nr:response regulator [Mariprofundus ferrinatatus]ATX82875.1 PAS domain S-box-containing protein [Mariprofundus ferrinatatus]
MVENETISNGMSEILVVDDTPASLKLITETLRGEGYQVRPANSGELALGSATAKPPQLILLDIRMPGMDGFEVIQKLKASEVTRDVPVIFLSASVELESHLKGFDLGAVDFVTKPFQRQELLARVRTHLELFQLRSQMERLIEDRTAALEESQLRFRRLVENLRNEYFLYEHDTEGLFTYVSPSITNLLGYSQDEFKTHYAEHLTDNPINQKVEEKTRLAIAGKQQPSYELEIFAKDGSRHWLEINESPVTDEAGKVVSIEGIAHDITDKKGLQQQFLQAQKMEALGTLVGGMAHDFNNLLAGIMGSLYIARRRIEKEPEQAREKIATAETLGSRAADMIKHLLTFARHGVVEKSPVPIKSMFKEACKLIEPGVPESISFKSSHDESDMVVMGSPAQLQQVLMNLVNNARDAVSDCEHPEITMSLKPYAADQAFSLWHPEIKAREFALIEVKDNGCGIAGQDIDKMFEPFYTTKEAGKGTGLGLAMVYGTVKDHGGVINVESRIGEGSTFQIFLPQEKAAIENLEGDGEEVSSSGDRTILLADDDDVLLLAYADILDALGYRVITARNGSEALSIYKEKGDTIDLVILDVVMPVMGGVDAANAIRQINPGQKVLFSTGYDLNQEMVAHLSEKNEKIISKPWAIAVASKTIHELLAAD